MSYVRPVLRWSWVTILLIVGTVVVILYYNANLPVQYTSTVKLQASAPEPDDVTLYSSVRAGTTREEISAVQADFQSIVRSPTAAQTTVKQLNLQMPWLEFLSHVSTEIPLYSDFVLVHVNADNPQDAETIARVHTDNAIRLYADTRALTPMARSQFIAQQLADAGKEMANARQAMLQFQIKYGTSDLTRDVQSLQDLIRSLQQDRDRNQVEIERSGSMAAYFVSNAEKAAANNDAATATAYRNSANASLASVEGAKAAVARLNELIAQRQNELTTLIGLTPEYNRLRTDVQQTEGTYNFLQSKLDEAQTKANDARAITYVQLAEPATTPNTPEKVSAKSMLIPGVAAALVLGVIVSFVLEFVFVGSRRRKSSK
jgi:uncharacterized protein involved in exopolysaccharide biosynthesis